MGSFESQQKRPHAVFMPFPAQGHMNPLLKLAKLLHSKGFFITFIHTALYHRRLLRSSSSSVSSSASFRFVTIDDGVSEDESTHTLHYVQDCMRRHCPASLRELLVREEDEGAVPPATCIVSDGVMSFTLDVAEELRLPQVLFWTMSACGFMGYLLFEEIIKRDMAPLKDDAPARDDARLDARIDWVPAMKNARLRDMPTFITHPSHPKHRGMVEFMIEECRNASRAAAIVLNTFDALERPVLDAISASLAPPILTVGPLMGLDNNNEPIFEEPKVWREEMGCLKWLEAQQDSSVLYVNFGSIAVMTSAQLSELAFGIAGSGCRFLWVVRPDSVDGGLDGLPAGFVEETTGRGLVIMGWCPQEEVLAHRAVGGFMTHSGWNSMLESVVEGVPMACLSSVAEQPTNSRFACDEWAVGLEIGLIGDLKRERVEGVIRELMEGEKGREIRKRALEVKREAWRAVKPGGSSYVNFDKLVYDVLKAPMTLNG